MKLPDFPYNHDFNGSFPVPLNLKGTVKLETIGLGTFTLKVEHENPIALIDRVYQRIYEPNRTVRTRTIRQQFSYGPSIRRWYGDDAPFKDRFFIWKKIGIINSSGKAKYEFQEIDPDWIGPDGRWKSSQYEYLARELYDR